MSGITKRRSKQPKFVPGEVADDDDDVWPRNSTKRGPGCCKEPACRDKDKDSDEDEVDDDDEDEDEDLDEKERKAQAGQKKRAQQKEKSGGIKWMPIFFLLLVTGPAIFTAVDWLMNLPIFKSSTPRPPRRLDPRSCLVKFYKEYNPQKLKEVDKILSKYQGKERDLFKNLERQYDMRIDCIER